MIARKLNFICMIPVVLGTFSACSNGPSFVMHPVGETKMVVTSAGAAISTVKTVDGREVVCVRLGPDAGSSTNSDLTLGIPGRGSESDDYGDKEAELIGRTPVNVLVRDLLFQICMARQSGLLTDDQYGILLNTVISRGLDLSEKEIRQIKFDISSRSAGYTSDRVAPTSDDPTVTDSLDPDLGG